jgi:GNAT superfamily N-acetyltransferase
MNLLRIDLLREPDLPAALRLSTQAGWNQIGADWRRLLALWPDTCLAGRLDGRLVTTATLATYGDVGWVGMVLVDESHRRRGFGTRMLDAVLDLGRARGVRRFGLDATDLGRPVYLGRGFVDAVGINRWLRPGAAPLTEEQADGWHGQGRLPVSSLPEPRASVLAHATPLPDGCAALDLRCCGVDRRRLLSHVAVEPSVRLIVDEESYAVLRPGRAAYHVGPLVAADEARAQEVLAGALALAGSTRAAVIDVPRGRLSNSLPAHGFEPVRRLVRMQTADTPAGHALAAAPPLLAGPGVFAACGFELG